MEDLRKIRKEKKLTQIQMAKAIGVKPSTYITWESGRSEPDFENRLKIDKFLKGGK